MVNVKSLLSNVKFGHIVYVGLLAGAASLHSSVSPVGQTGFYLCAGFAGLLGLLLPSVKGTPDAS